jgi:hypothetical protein
MRWLAPGQQQLDPIELPISWGRLPPEAELRIAVRIEPKFNTRVAPQAGQVAAIVFGTPPGRCPPGELLTGYHMSRSSSRVFAAALFCACVLRRAVLSAIAGAGQHAICLRLIFCLGADGWFLQALCYWLMTLTAATAAMMDLPTQTLQPCRS